MLFEIVASLFDDQPTAGAAPCNLGDLVGIPSTPSSEAVSDYCHSLFSRWGNEDLLSSVPPGAILKKLLKTQLYREHSMFFSSPHICTGRWTGCLGVLLGRKCLVRHRTGHLHQEPEWRENNMKTGSRAASLHAQSAASHSDLWRAHYGCRRPCT